jgi:hypothetical protein
MSPADVREVSRTPVCAPDVSTRAHVGTCRLSKRVPTAVVLDARRHTTARKATILHRDVKWKLKIRSYFYFTRSMVTERSE